MNQGAKREEGIVSTKENGDNVSRKRGHQGWEGQRRNLPVRGADRDAVGGVACFKLRASPESVGLCSEDQGEC